jgi:hypothetical protein|tara:strand:- start:39 stop:575 length:537 start_codon:yes stop_codon:yes gene_type:complete
MNTYTFNISTTGPSTVKVYPTVELFDVTRVTLNLVDIYSDTFPNYLAIDWGDNTPVLRPDVSVFRDYKKDSIYPEINKGVAPKYITDIYQHIYEPSSYALKKSVVLKINVGYITGQTTQLSAPLNIRTQGYYETVGDMELIGVDLLNNKYNSSRFTLLTKESNHIVQLDNKSYKEDTA